MKQFDKWFFPDHEEHLPQWMANVGQKRHGRLCYQIAKYEEAMKYVKGRRTAIDVGSHVGLWAFHMAHDFEDVHCFEPMPPHVECWTKNMDGIENAYLYECALGDKFDFVAVKTRTANSSGDTGVDGAGDIPMKPLDDFDFENVDFIKIDCEGFEKFVLLGAEKTLLKNKPCVIVEQKPNMGKRYGLGEIEAVEYLQNLGAKLKSEISGDYILAWD
jgi:FkbM family methyltransferase